MTRPPTFWATVRGVILADSGARVPVTFDVEFKRLPQTELDQFAKRNDTVIDDADIVNVAIDRIMELAIGWRGVTYEEGDVVEFSREAVRRMVDEFGLGAEILAARRRALARGVPADGLGIRRLRRGRKAS